MRMEFLAPDGTRRPLLDVRAGLPSTLRRPDSPPPHASAKARPRPPPVSPNLARDPRGGGSRRPTSREKPRSAPREGCLTIPPPAPPSVQAPPRPPRPRPRVHAPRRRDGLRYPHPGQHRLHRRRNHGYASLSATPPRSTANAPHQNPEPRRRSRDRSRGASAADPSHPSHPRTSSPGVPMARTRSMPATR